MIKVMIFDDNIGRLEGLELLINHTKGMACIGTFLNCKNILLEISSNKPDVVLMDIDMPGINGVEALKLLRIHAPEIMVIMQTVFEDEEKIFEAIHEGAHGYFLKKTSPEKLIAGITDVLEGGAPMTTSVAKKVLEMFRNQPAKKTNNFQLTEREQLILSYLIKGHSYKMIAEECHITWHTVNSHCKKIYEKLHVHSASEAVAKAMNYNL
jgi:DNA-binding NarL/FixJ family response regulator